MLSDADLYQRHDTMRELKTETYEKIFRKCVNSIKACAKNGDLICSFPIPVYVLGTGYPRVDPVNCSVYLKERLLKENSNLKISFVSPNILFVDWRR